ncbi:hypothetical protein [Kitasatospora sp. NPDC050463]|uniref:hypothetical protein n=1 Tax=Kitasatospora sp. NPDC050463 TaxID=3155786 RepID=UPI0033E1C0F9
MSVHRILINCALFVLGPAALLGLLRQLGLSRLGAGDRHPAAERPERADGRDRARHCPDRPWPVEPRRPVGNGRPGGACRERDHGRGRTAPRRRCHRAGPGVAGH